MSPMAKCPNKDKTNMLYYVLYCKKCDFVYFFEQKNIEQKKHLSQKLGEARICTVLDIWQFFLRLMALSYLGKLLIVWKCAYSGFQDFLGQISSCKIGVKKANKSTFFLLWDFKLYCYLHMNVNLDIIIHILVDIRTSKMVIMPIMIIIMIIFTIIIWKVNWDLKPFKMCDSISEALFLHLKYVAVNGYYFDNGYDKIK